MTKKVASFLEVKIGVTPSVSAPGDTNPSDATAVQNKISSVISRHMRPFAQTADKASEQSTVALMIIN